MASKKRVVPFVPSLESVPPPTPPKAVKKPPMLSIPKVTIAALDNTVQIVGFKENKVQEQIPDSEDYKGVPPIVLALCKKINEQPWTWFVEEPRVVIVARSGKKFRFERQ